MILLAVRIVVIALTAALNMLAWSYNRLSHEAPFLSVETRVGINRALVCILIHTFPVVSSIHYVPNGRYDLRASSLLISYNINKEYNKWP